MLQIKHVSKTFYTNDLESNQIFNDLNLTIEEGEFVTIIGSNGAGKSTLFNLISQNIKIDQGEILIGGKAAHKQNEYHAARSIARIYQNPNLNVALNMTVLENVNLAMNKGKPFNLTWAVKKSLTSQIKKDLESINIGIENNLKTKTKFLSGGQRQALCLYMASLSHPDLLLLDEHTAALDPQSTEIVLAFTKSIVEQKKLTTIMITHNMKQAIEYGNRLIMLHKGQVVIDLKGEEKRQLTVDKLLALFEDIKGEMSDALLFG